MHLLKSSALLILFLQNVNVWADEKYKILAVFPLLSVPNVQTSSSLLRQLIHNGHSVTEISPFPKTLKKPNYRHIYLDGLVDQEMGNLRKPDFYCFKLT